MSDYAVAKAEGLKRRSLDGQVVRSRSVKMALLAITIANPITLTSHVLLDFLVIRFFAIWVTLLD
jgi:hypothetical protein